jgi:hypothetical protein
MGSTGRLFAADTLIGTSSACSGPNAAHRLARRGTSGTVLETTRMDLA